MISIPDIVDSRWLGPVPSNWLDAIVREHEVQSELRMAYKLANKGIRITEHDIGGFKICVVVHPELDGGLYINGFRSSVLT